MAWKKIEDKIFKFDQVGDEIEGILISAEDSRNYNNKVYKLDKDGESSIVFGTVVLDTLMIGIPIGTKIKISLTGFKANKNKGQSDIKLFDVFRDE